MEQFESALKYRGREDLSAEVAGFTRRFDFDTLAVTTVVDLLDDSAEVARMVTGLRLFAAYAPDASATVLIASSPHAEDPGLTPRELECLRWTTEGKTAWEVGNILGISEQTAARHLNNATRKLGCANKLQAVVKALRLGLVR